MRTPLYLVLAIFLLIMPSWVDAGINIDLNLPLGFKSMHPPQFSSVRMDRIVLKGELKPDFKLKSVRIKGDEAIIRDNSFETGDIQLREGMNSMLIELTDVNGRRRLVSYSINYEPKPQSPGGGSLVDRPVLTLDMTAEGYTAPPKKKLSTRAIRRTENPPSPAKNDNLDVVFSSPYMKQIITEDKLKIGGRFNKDAGIASITVNGQACVLDPSSGTFKGPMLISPGEARKKKVNSDSAEYIIMRVNPENHSGMNELKVVVRPNEGKPYEDRIVYYYYKLFVMTHISGSDVYNCEDGFQMSTPCQTIQSYNKDLLEEPPFGGWPYPEKGYRYDIPLNRPGLYYYNDDSVPYYFTESYPLLYYYTGLETYRGQGYIRTYIKLHSPPVDNTPFVVLLKYCSFLEDLPFFPRYTISSISGYKINGVELTQLGPDPRTSYVVLDNPSPDTDFSVSVDTPYYGEGFRIYSGYIDRHFAAEFHEGFTGDILVDSNNDGFLGGEDNAVEQNEPGCVFWVNDDDDYNESSIHPDDRNPDLASGERDAYDEKINGIRDLEDFMPMDITIPGIKYWSSPDKNIKYYLKIEGSAKIRIFERVKDVDDHGHYTYIKDIGSSIAQYQNKPIPVDKDNENIIPLTPDLFNDKGGFYAIFEGIEAGTATITLIAELGTDPSKKEKVILDEAIVTLVNVKSMYKVYNTRYDSETGYNEGPVIGDDGLLRYRFIREQKGYGARFPENPNRIIIWTHGYNNSEHESLKNMEILFKRLYITGYRGGFIGIVWHVHKWEDEYCISNRISWIAFNPDWEKSYRSGHVFADIIRNIDKSYKDAQLDLFIHSLGGNLGCYALRLLAENNEEVVDNLILHEAAVPEEVFCGNYSAKGRPYRLGFFDNIYAESLKAVKGRVYNTYCPEDVAVWVAFPLNNALFSMPTPLDDSYKYINNAIKATARPYQGGLGSSKAKTIYGHKIVSKNQFMNKNKHPYGIRTHGSQSEEYYSDVMKFFNNVVWPITLLKDEEEED
ncbi:MAG: alpha/beta hydrolase [Candidatus Omnitrophica bacterium]|nr:alpha/beta hydrolase [Candidatus Omnitrophota bacterium]